MKKTIISALFLAFTTTASADVLLGGDFELNVWNSDYEVSGMETSGKSSNYFGSASIEHGVPLIPNFKFSFAKVDSDGYEYVKNDLTMYYEILDNDLVSVDIGVGATQFTSGVFNAVKFDGVLPHIYAGAEFGIPSTPITLYSDVSMMKYQDSSIVDATVGARYDIELFAMDVGIQAGYKYHSADLDDFDSIVAADLKTDGFFVGLNLDF
jgi:outer membrane protein